MAFFVFAMLLLDLGRRFLLLLAGWGLVGLASYLLIGFWRTRRRRSRRPKAFVMNAVGDATMALRLFVIIWQTGTLAFATRSASRRAGRARRSNLVALGLLGAVAKSRRSRSTPGCPAMEDPTPVSALIHAATMVTTGSTCSSARTRSSRPRPMSRCWRRYRAP